MIQFVRSKAWQSNRDVLNHEETVVLKPEIVWGEKTRIGNKQGSRDLDACLAYVGPPHDRDGWPTLYEVLCSCFLPNLYRHSRALKIT